MKEMRPLIMSHHPEIIEYEEKECDDADIIVVSHGVDPEPPMMR